MMRNDYRRSLILLRSNASGYSGHVRLERRTLMGTMYFLVQSPGDCPALRAALVGRGRDGACYACALGELQRDARGQAVLSYSFDPRDICRKELEQYQLIAVTCAGDASCQVVLFGNVCGHAELNWEAVRGALCELYAGEQAGNEPSAQAETAPATELPEARPDASAEAPSPASEAAAPEGEGNAARQIAQAEAASEAPQEGATAQPGNSGEACQPQPPQAISPDDAAQESASALPGEVGGTYQSRAAQAVSPDNSPQGEAGDAAGQSGVATFEVGAAGTAGWSGAATYSAEAAGTAGQGGAAAYGVEAPASGAPDGAASSDSSAGATTLPDSAQSGAASEEALACDLLEAQGVHSSAPWPEPAEALRALFQSEPALTDAPDDQCVYVEAPMPEGSGFPFVAAGLLILGGALAAIRYALPAAWSEEPPAGLEDCAWVGDQNRGWWVSEVPVDGDGGLARSR